MFKLQAASWAFRTKPAELLKINLTNLLREKHIYAIVQIIWSVRQFRKSTYISRLANLVLR